MPTPAGHPEPWTVWRNWLAQRGLGLVPIAEPARFDWPGPWLGLVSSGDSERAVVAFGAPPGIAWSPLDAGDRFEDVTRGFVIAPAAPARWTPVRRAVERRAGRVDLIAVAPDAGAPMRAVDRVAARAGRGLAGDRYVDGRGTFSDPHAKGLDLTLIEAEVIDELGSGGDGLGALEARRNIVVRGIDLHGLAGRRFAIGSVVCLGQRLCEPCAHLERLTRPGVLRALVHRGGLRADILSDGIIAVGDEIRPLDDGAAGWSGRG